MKKKVVLFSSIIFLLFFIVFFVTTMKSFQVVCSKSAKSISDVSVKAQSRKVGSSASYHLSVTVNKMLPKNSWIKIHFPDEFDFSETQGNSLIDVDSEKCTITYFLSMDFLPGTKTIVIPDLVGIKNPLFAGDYVLKVLYQNDYEWITSNSFSIFNSQIGFPVGIPEVKVTTSAPKKISSYYIKFNVGEAGWLGKGEGAIRLRFPKETIFSKEIVEMNSILINNTPLEKDLKIRGSSLFFITPIEIIDSGFVEIYISNEAGIINPSQSGAYTLFVSTMPADPLWVSSSPYEINE